MTGQRSEEGELCCWVREGFQRLGCDPVSNDLPQFCGADCFPAWLPGLRYFLGSVGSHRKGVHRVGAVLEQVSKVSALWEGGGPGKLPVWEELGWNVEEEEMLKSRVDG